MENEKMVQVEIKGQTYEVPEKYAKKIDTFRIGQNVRVLKKKYQDSYEVYPGVIVGFDAFEKLPTIVICYLEVSYSDVKVEFVYLNEESFKEGEFEIAPMHDISELHFKKSDVLDKMGKEVSKLEEQIKDIERKRAYFEANFDKYFKIEEKEKV